MSQARPRYDAHTLATAGDDAPDDGVRWLALVIGEMLRVGLSLIAKRYPDARGAMRCPHCGHRSGT